MITDITRGMLLFRRPQKKIRSREASARPQNQSHELVLGLTSTGQRVLWPSPSAQAASHMVCLAASGAGKTIAIGNALLREFVSQAQTADPNMRGSMLVCDPKGDLVEIILHGLLAIAPELLDSCVQYLNPFAGGFKFNVNKLALGQTPVDIAAMRLGSLVSTISTAAGAQKHLGVGARQLDVLQHVILGALDSNEPQANILWALDALVLPQGLRRLAAVTRNQRAKMFLQSARLSDELRASTASRLRTAFSASSNLERLVTSEDSIQFADLLAPGKLTLLNLGQPTGGLTSLQEFWANLFCRLAIDFLLERKSPWPGHHCRIAIDEAQVVAGVLADTAERVLTQGRSRQVSLVALSQGTTLIHQASNTLLQVLLTNTSTKLIGRLAAQDAELLARSQSPAQGMDESISSIRQRFISSVTNLADREFFRLVPGERERFTSATVEVEAWKEAAEERAERLEALKNRLAVPVSDKPRTTLANVRVGKNRSAPKPRNQPQAKPRKGSKWG